MRQNEKNVAPQSNEKRNTWARGQLQKGLLDLMEEKDPDQISISELCQSAGVGRATFYRNYENKDDILIECIEPVFSDWTEDVKAHEDKGISYALKSLLLRIKKEERLFGLLTHYNRLDLTRTAMVNLYAQNKDIKKDMTMVEAYSWAFVVYVFYGWLETWLIRGMKDDIDALCALLPKGNESGS